MAHEDHRNHPIEYVVVGKGDFPLDMLRYDEAWPATEDDALRAQDPSRGWREVRLRTHRFRKSIGTSRWRSFGWDVSNKETR